MQVPTCSLTLDHAIVNDISGTQMITFTIWIVSYEDLPSIHNSSVFKLERRSNLYIYNEQSADCVRLLHVNAEPVDGIRISPVFIIEAV